MKTIIGSVAVGLFAVVLGYLYDIPPAMVVVSALAASLGYGYLSRENA